MAISNIGNRRPPTDVRSQPSLQAALDAHVRTLNIAHARSFALPEHGIEFVGDIVPVPPPEILTWHGWGKQSVNALAEVVLARTGLELGTPLSGWKRPGTKGSSSPRITRRVLDVTVDGLLLTPARKASLRHNGIHFVGELLAKHPSELLRIPNWGPKAVNELNDALVKLTGHPLGTVALAWRPPKREDLFESR